MQSDEVNSRLVGEERTRQLDRTVESVITCTQRDEKTRTLPNISASDALVKDDPSICKKTSKYGFPSNIFKSYCAI